MKGISIAGQTAGEAAWSISVFVLGLGVTAAFGYYLAADPTRLTAAWEWTRSLNIFLQLLIWLLFLPWMAALWIFVQPWAAPIRIVLVVGTLAFTNWLLWPWKA